MPLSEAVRGATLALLSAGNVRASESRWYRRFSLVYVHIREKKPHPLPAPYKIAIIFYAVIGLLGSFWISDEWDQERLIALAFIGIPLLTSFYMSHYYRPLWHYNLPLVHVVMAGLIVGVFTLGHIAILNSIFVKSEPVKVFIEGQTTTSMEWHHQRGRLGLLFKHRW